MTVPLNTQTQFRKKPVVITAKQWHSHGDHDAVEELPASHPAWDSASQEKYRLGWVKTLEGGHVVTPGDWIITGVKGEHYPCTPGIFELTYEPALAALASKQAPPEWTPEMSRAVVIKLDLTIRGDSAAYYFNERGGHSSFDPLADDGDAFRLACALGIRCEPMSSYCVSYAGSVCAQQFSERSGNDRPAAMRRAITRAAAEIGKEMK